MTTKIPRIPRTKPAATITIALFLGVLVILCSCDRERKSAHGHEEGHEESSQSGMQKLVVHPGAIKRHGIQVAKVQPRALQLADEVPAELQLDPDRVAHLSSLVSGRVTIVKATLGSKVKAGQTLAVLESIQVGEARAALAQAKARTEIAASQAERQETLHEEGIGAEKNLVAARAERKSAEAEQAAALERLSVLGTGRQRTGSQETVGGRGATVYIKSSIAGEVIERHATRGEVVSADRTLFVVANTSVLWAVGRAYPQQLPSIREGMQARLVLRDLPGTETEGVVDYVAPALKDTTRTLPIRMVVQNTKGMLRPGLFGSIQFHESAEKASAVLAVVQGAVQKVEGKNIIFVPLSKRGAFKAQEVRLGQRERSADGFIEVKEGLQPGQSYVSQGSFWLKSELLRDELEEDDD